MIAVDTSALMAIVLGEPEADACIAALVRETDFRISAGTFRGPDRRRPPERGGRMERLIEGLGMEIVTVTPAAARRIAHAYGKWGMDTTSPVSTSATASRTMWRRSMAARCSMSAPTFAGTDVDSAL